jgi:signal transduction histidine kinase
MLGWSAVHAEAISNAVRHARPTIISVSLRRNPPNLVLKIRDNGLESLRTEARNS